MENTLINKFKELEKDGDVNKLKLEKREVRLVIMALVAVEAYEDCLDNYLGLRNKIRTS